MAATLFRFGTSLTRSCPPICSTLSRLPFCTASASPPKRVGTHNGTFHCDEALGCFMISLISNFHAAQSIRTRSLEVLDTLDAVVDVGGVYDPNIDRYDHHQKGFHETLGNGFGTKLSSAGLVYKAVDAIDNGINQYETDQSPRYVNNTTLSSRISRLNVNWYDDDRSPDKEDQAFQAAMTLAGSEFMDCVHFHAKSWLQQDRL